MTCSKLEALGATTLVTICGLGVLAVAHQDPAVVAAWRDVSDDGSKLTSSLARAVRETVAFGDRIGGIDRPTPLA